MKSAGMGTGSRKSWGSAGAGAAWAWAWTWAVVYRCEAAGCLSGGWEGGDRERKRGGGKCGRPASVKWQIAVLAVEKSRLSRKTRSGLRWMTITARSGEASITRGARWACGKRSRGGPLGLGRESPGAGARRTKHLEEGEENLYTVPTQTRQRKEAMPAGRRYGTDETNETNDTEDWEQQIEIPRRGQKEVHQQSIRIGPRGWARARIGKVG
ncbi:hypothetical protein F4780DRAFT_269979 [Xylariomycetidae sp. FL0641]|nr:hypothetical protein F4780DRAFT_269979 [Xylariomycetidae sp. FL0641]